MGTAATAIDQAKLDRLTAAAQGGSEGLKQFDAAQASVGQEKAAMAAGLAGDARTAGYAGPSLGGAPTVLNAQLGAGLSPYQQALASGRTNFTQNLQEGTAASLRYLDAAKAAEAPTLAAAAKGGGGGGGGRGGGAPKPISNTALLTALIGSASTLRAAQLQAISQKGANDLGQAQTAISSKDAPQQIATTITNRMKAENQWSGPGSAPVAGFKGDQFAPVAPVAPASTAPPKVLTDRINALQALYNRLSGQAQTVVPQQYQREFLMPPSQIIHQELSTNPTGDLASSLSRFGVTPDRVAAELTPQRDATWLSAVKRNLPKAAAVAAKPAGKPLPVPYEEAATSAGISTDPKVLAQILGTAYTKAGYTKNPDGTYTGDNKTTVAGAHIATGNLVDDVMREAESHAKAGFDGPSFIAWLQGSPFKKYIVPPTLPLSKYTREQAALRLAVYASGGYFDVAPAQPARPAQPIIPNAPFLSTSPYRVALGE